MCGKELKAPSTIIGFTDSSWGDEKPASGYCCYYKGSLVSWASRRLKTTPLSSCEAEYAAATNAAGTLIFVKELIQFIHPQLKVGNIRLYCDNSAACQLSDNAMSGKRVKHVMRQLAFLRELKEKKELSLHFVSGDINIADAFTKPLATARFKELRDRLLLTNEDQDATTYVTQSQGVPSCPRASKRVLILFSGPYNRPDGLQVFLNKVGLEATMVDSDEKHGGNAAHDILEDEFYTELLRRTESGEFLAIVAAPPCSTFSVARHFKSSDPTKPGPPPVRNRENPRGIPGLGPLHAKEVKRANIIIARTCAILTAAANVGTEFIIENPADHGDPSNKYCYLHHEHCPLWLMDEVRTLETLSSGQKVTFPFCALGHESQKMTTLLYTPGLAASLSHLSQLRCTHKTHKQVGGITKNGKFTSSMAARYPGGFNLILAQSVASLMSQEDNTHTNPHTQARQP